MPREQAVELSIYDLGGRRVAVVQRGVLAAGEHRLEWGGRTDSGAPAASGVYLVRFRSGDFTQVRRLLLVR